MQSAIYVSHDSRNGYGHVRITVGCLDMNERAPMFRYIDASADYGQDWCLSLSCQIGGGGDTERRYQLPYAVKFAIDPRGMSEGVELGRMAALAKVEARVQRALAKVAAKLGAPESFEDHALHLFLATRPAYLITEKRHWTDGDRYVQATADEFRQQVRRAVRDVRAALYPASVEVA